MKLLSILFCCSICVSCNLKTNFSLTAKKISFNKDINGSLVVQLLQVDSSGADGFPARFTPESTYTATGLRNLPYNEVAALLPEHIRGEFLKHAWAKDSITKKMINDTLIIPDTVKQQADVAVYRINNTQLQDEWNKADEKTQEIILQHIPWKKTYTYYFGKGNKYFRWRAGAGDWTGPQSTVNGFTLIPGRWYTTRFFCAYGLLTDGYCTLFFSADEQGRIRCKQIDEKNDGPF